MIIKIINKDFTENQFNQKSFHPLQSWQWGEARKEMNVKILRVAEFEEKNLKNVFTISFHKIPFFSFKIGYLPRSVFPSKQLLDFFYQYAKKNRVVFIKIEPYQEISNLIHQFGKISNQQLKFKNLIKSPHPLFPKWTQILNLNKSEKELIKSFHPKTRYNIRLAQKKGVIVKEMTNEKGFKIFSKLYFTTCQRQRYFGHSLKYHQIVFKNLKEKIAHILISFYKNEPLAAYQIWIYKDVAYYVYGGSSEKYRNLMGANLLMWEAIKFAKNKGAKKFDMWGSLPPNYSLNHPWAGFTRFKQGYGGKFVEMVGSFDLIINPNLYFFYNLAYFIRSFFLKLIKKLS
ncbi:MAG: aminoacyltransferase [Patescibacteria group bacterium]|nr:aminoacyltransferase [Patescibacteria group bacterium]